MCNILDRPEVVWAKLEHTKVALHFAFLQPQVDWQVIHYRGCERFLASHLVAVDLFDLVNATGLEVVTQAKRVTDFVSNQVG